MRSSPSQRNFNLLPSRPNIYKVLSQGSFRFPIAPILVVTALVCSLMMTLFLPGVSHAQTPPNLRIPATELPDLESSDDEEEERTFDSTSTPRTVIVDTDPGVDDAAALIWLFSQQKYPIKVLGVVTVAGNTTVENASNNARSILDWLGQASVPIIQGASAPLNVPLSRTPAFIHGLDGLWFTATAEGTPDLADATATEFYCESDHLEPGLLVLALGPLTNIASALQACPDAWAGVEIVSLGGGKTMGNQTPVSEFNYWQDPDAAAQVLAHTLLDDPASPSLQLVPVDAFSQFEVKLSDFVKLQNNGVPAIANLFPALEIYMSTFAANGESATLPDVVAAMYALENEFGTAQPALVQVLHEEGVPEVARGQTIIGLGFNERLTMIASDAELSAIALSALTDPNFDFNSALYNILIREPDNALVVVDIEAKRMNKKFLKALRNDESVRISGGVEDFGDQLFVPFITDGDE